MMQQEMAKETTTTKTATNPGAQNNALLDWGEALLN